VALRMRAARGPRTPACPRGRMGARRDAGAPGVPTAHAVSARCNVATSGTPAVSNVAISRVSEGSVVAVGTARVSKGASWAITCITWWIDAHRRADRGADGTRPGTALHGDAAHGPQRLTRPGNSQISRVRTCQVRDGAACKPPCRRTTIRSEPRPVMTDQRTLPGSLAFNSWSLPPPDQASVCSVCSVVKQDSPRAHTSSRIAPGMQRPGCSSAPPLLSKRRGTRYADRTLPVRL
jgi:hypothetical protein